MPILSNRVLARLASLFLAASSALACTDKPQSGAAPVAAPTAVVEPASKVLGVEPAAPTKEAKATTSPAKSDITPAQQSSSMPMPGQANDHSTLATDSTLKSHPNKASKP